MARAGQWKGGETQGQARLMATTLARGRGQASIDDRSIDAAADVGTRTAKMESAENNYEPKCGFFERCNRQTMICSFNVHGIVGIDPVFVL